MVRYTLAAPCFDASLVRDELSGLVPWSFILFLGLPRERAGRNYLSPGRSHDRNGGLDSPARGPLRFRGLDCGDLPNWLAHFQDHVGVRFLLFVHTTRIILQINRKGRIGPKAQ
jgi:hypothetical protein